jgi:hypothetical protein
LFAKAGNEMHSNANGFKVLSLIKVPKCFRLNKYKYGAFEKTQANLPPERGKPGSRDGNKIKSNSLL